ncbi:hypothetical protein AB0F81_45425 [Actinoplanes sp. NPDC024001]|uniref:hypothetical protein n=1 Tax=Actinoplanes sp. NPDC024001 TaxID=3154598 RepID=UPI0033DC0BE6
MNERVDVIMPVASVPDLRVPPLAVTTGDPRVEWVDMPNGTWAFQLRPTMRIPYDPAGAVRARRHLRALPVDLAIRLVFVLIMLTTFVGEGPFLGLSSDTWLWARLGAIIAVIAWSFPLRRWLPEQYPVTQAGRVVRVPHLPCEVAEEWVRLNPETVRIVAENVPVRRYRPRVYVIWSAACFAGALLVGVALVRDAVPGRLWLAVPALLIAAVVAIVKGAAPGLRPTFPRSTDGSR